MSKPNVSEGFRQKVKQFFGVKKGHVITSSVYEGPKPDELIFHQELLQEIGKESSLSNRVKVLKELCDFLASRRVEDHAVEAAWTAVCDMLSLQNPLEARHVTLKFLTVMISGQFNRLGILRAHFFSVVANHKIPEDITPRLELLKALSDNGKDISYFEEMTGPFLLSWMPEVMQKGRVDVFMLLLINVIHYNSSFLDEEIISGVVRETCHLSRTTKEEEEVEGILTAYAGFFACLAGVTYKGKSEEFGENIASRLTKRCHFVGLGVLVTLVRTATTKAKKIIGFK